jgi:hypothetical protein
MNYLTITEPKTDRAKKLVEKHGDKFLLEGNVAGVCMIHALADDDLWFGWINREEAEYIIEYDDGSDEV